MAMEAVAEAGAEPMPGLRAPDRYPGHAGRRGELSCVRLPGRSTKPDGSRSRGTSRVASGAALLLSSGTVTAPNRSLR